MATCRQVKAAHDRDGSGGQHHDGGGRVGSDGFIDLHQIDTLMSGPAAAVAAGGAGARGTPALRQQTALVISESGSVFDDGMVLHSGAAAAAARSNFGDGGGLRRRRGEKAGNVSETTQTGER